MELKLFATNLAGAIPLATNRSLYRNEKLRIMIIPNLNVAKSLTDLQLEIISPIELPVFTDALPTIEPTKVLFFDITIPASWLAGYYRIRVYSRKNNAMSRSAVFRLLPKGSTDKQKMRESLAPKWRLRYSFRVSNPTNNPIGNFSAFIALPTTIYPQQIVKNLTIKAKEHKLATDVEGNHWARIEIKKIPPNAAKELGYSALIENKALTIARNLADNVSSRSYREEFYRKYLQSEPHIESDHPKIIALTEKISFRNPVNFAKEAVKSINRYLTYQIQEQEHGTAYAVTNRVGDCTEFAALFVAMCRAVGIPARTAAGFTFNQQWERHATAEFMVAGRWIPIDPTGQKQSDIFIGTLPANIIITRGNWMGHTLTKEASYKYQVLNPTQKLRVDIAWEIDLENSNKNSNIPPSLFSSSIRILDNMHPIQKVKKAKLVSSPQSIQILNPSRTLKIRNQTIDSSSIIQLPSAKNQSKTGKKVDLTVDMPDILKAQKKLLTKIVLQNNLERKIAGVIEIREIIGEVIKIRALTSKTLSVREKASFTQGINLEGHGSSEYEFVFLNRIGRTIAKTKKKLTLF
jgi:hypothetical protein